MSRRPEYFAAAALLIIVATVAVIIYLRTGGPVRIEVTGTEGLVWKGTVIADGAQVEVSGPVFSTTNPPNAIRVASARSVEFTIEKKDGPEGELIVDVFRDDERALHAKAGTGLRSVRGKLGPGGGAIEAEG